MNEQKAIKILGDTIQKDKSLRDSSKYIDCDVDYDTICLDGFFEVKELEAIVWWIKNKYNI